MDRLKPFFISLFITFASVVGLYGVWVLLAQGFAAAWAGLTVTALAAAGFFARIFLAPSPRTSENLLPLTAVIAAGAVATAGAAWKVGENAGTAVVAVAVLASWLIYLRWYSRYPHRSDEELAVGKKLPSFTVKDLEGKDVSSESFRGSPTLLLFYRGNWCPFCTAQVRELAEQYRALNGLGVQVALISSQPPGKTRSLAAKFDVPFRFLVDVDNGAARRVGVAAPKGLPAGLELLGYASDTVMPTVVITDDEGKILYADLTDNYRRRPEPEEFLRIFREAGVAG